jgi:hypothetical protein
VPRLVGRRAVVLCTSLWDVKVVSCRKQGPRARRYSPTFHEVQCWERSAVKDKWYHVHIKSAAPERV